MKKTLLALSAAIAATLAMPTTLAETGIGVGPGGTASARLDFQVSVPEFLFFRVGSPGTTIDLVDFNLAGATLGNSTPIPATSGTVEVQIITSESSSSISLSSFTAGPLQSGADTIPFSEVTATSVGGNILPPALADGVTTVGTPVTMGGATNITDTWAFALANTISPPAGVYTGQATYTAALP